MQQQTDAKTKTAVMADGARYLIAEAVKQPVKEAVKEALREEADIERADDFDRTSASRSTSRSQSSDGSGGSKLGLLVMGMIAATGLTYLVRKRRQGSQQSTWSEFDQQGESQQGMDQQSGTQRGQDQRSGSQEFGGQDTETATSPAGAGTATNESETDE